MANNISSNTKNRLPFYLEYLRKIYTEGQVNISSGAIAQALNLGEVQVRKDLASVSSNGKPKVGYEIVNLIKDLEDYLGYKDTDDAVVFGAGKLGMALLDYQGFLECGLNLVGAFDVDKKKHGVSESGKIIEGNEYFPSFNKDNKVKIGILCVPENNAQEVCDFMIQNGIKAILNFAPIHLNVPEDIIVKNENLAYSLALLSIELKSKEKNE
ncbi:MAG: redox-sensing transcriptional repressor Rex [Bacilli bacterium]|nr:redox-sensing transcriptional repressor Rex [Bacilli bacterium]